MELDRDRPLSGAVSPGRFSAELPAAIGIYGAISFPVTRRTHEMGAARRRGARHAGVLRAVVRQGTLLAPMGIATACRPIVAFGRRRESGFVAVPHRSPASPASPLRTRPAGRSPPAASRWWRPDANDQTLCALSVNIAKMPFQRHDDQNR